MQKASQALLDSVKDNYGTILLLDAPKGIQVGIDFMMWTIGEKFMGINLIPMGIHYLYWIPSSQEIEMVKTGMFINFPDPHTILVMKWDKQTETFIYASSDETLRYQEGVQNLHFLGNLGPYPLDKAASWKEATYFIDPEVIHYVQPISQMVGSSIRPVEFDADMIRSAEARPDSKSTEAVDTKLETFAENRIVDALFFTEIPKLNAKNDMVGENLTNYYFDTSHKITCMLENIKASKIKNRTKKAENFLLGEYQIAFICFMLTSNYDAFVHWQNLMSLLSNCEQFVETHQEFVANILRTFYVQLDQCPAEFLMDPEFQNKKLMQNYFHLIMITQNASNSIIQGRRQKLENLLESKTGNAIPELEYLIDNELGPTIVDFTETRY